MYQELENSVEKVIKEIDKSVELIKLSDKTIFVSETGQYVTYDSQILKKPYSAEQEQYKRMFSCCEKKY